MPPESRIDRRVEAALLLTMSALTAWSWTTTKWCARRVNRTRRWWGF
jgi:hypothetical protein